MANSLARGVSASSGIIYLRAEYAYRQEVTLQELEKGGGYFRERREVIFSPTRERTERTLGKPEMRLSRIRLTEEDFRDLREIQPVLLTRETLGLYRIRPRGEEKVEGQDCWVLDVAPRQILDGQRFFEGVFWVLQSDYSIVRAQGRAVPQQFGRPGKENLFPHFTTIRARQKDGFWFPVETVGDDTLPFSSGPIRIRLTVRYLDYRRFGAESTITFEK
ncbi:MAG: outer membrane lipoprotein-sorting protein [Bryobacter sp.]|nr:outer membrane lipoprotein-sorting protein [Bryobacter sp.]